MASHTPGPWKAGEYSNRIIGANGVKVCDVAYSSKRPLNEQEANERLIAAAPDLLKTLFLAASQLETGVEPLQVAQQCRAAIAKATA